MLDGIVAGLLAQANGDDQRDSQGTAEAPG